MKNSKIKDYGKIDSSINDQEEISMNIVITLFHEYLGHKNISFSEINNTSPKQFLKSGKLIELFPYKDLKKYLKLENAEFILSSHSKNKGDSGHFIELAYGKIEDKLLINVLYSIHNKKELLKRADLFVDKTSETLKKFVTLKIGGLLNEGPKFLQKKRKKPSKDKKMTKKIKLNGKNRKLTSEDREEKRIERIKLLLKNKYEIKFHTSMLYDLFKLGIKFDDKDLNDINYFIKILSRKVLYRTDD